MDHTDNGEARMTSSIVGVLGTALVLFATRDVLPMFDSLLLVLGVILIAGGAAMGERARFARRQNAAVK